MQKILSLLIISIFLSYFSFGNEIDSLLQELDKYMNQREYYDGIKENKLIRLKDLLKETDISNEQIYLINKQIISEYEAYNFDSCLFYIHQNQVLAAQINQTNYIIETYIKLSGLLGISGRYKESIDILKRIQMEQVPLELRSEFFKHYSKLYANLATYSTLDENTKYYNEYYRRFTDSLANYLNYNDESYLAIQEYKTREAGNLLDSKKTNSRRLAMTQMGTRPYSIAAYDRSLIYEMEKDTEQQKKYLILSAISDIKSSTKDNASLSLLAIFLHKELRIEKAYEYINFSLEDATFYNSQLRYVTLSNILPVIHEAYQLDSEKQKINLKKSIKVISLLLLALLLAFGYIYWQMKKLANARNELKIVNSQLKQLNSDLHNSNNNLNTLNKELSESNHVKEQYIANFLKICSNYIDKLDNYRKMVSRQITNRKIQELHELTKSNRLIDTELIEFYDNFDSTFLSIYPNFVSELNSLLNEEEQIVLKKSETLNTELRIFALIRLGINDSSKIAKLLRYSVNTIYNYRVRIKNKAAGNRDDFEKMIMNIDSFKG